MIRGKNVLTLPQFQPFIVQPVARSLSQLKMNSHMFH